MATTAYVEFTSAASVTPGAQTWVNASLALTINNDYAYVNLDAEESYQLKVTNPGTGFAEVAGKTIDGIEVEIRGTGQDGAGQDLTDRDIRLIIGGTVVGNDKAIATQWTDTSIVTRTYGGAADKWGLTPAHTDINSSTLGVMVAFENNDATSAQMRVATIRMRVTYSDPAAGGDTTNGMMAFL